MVQELDQDNLQEVLNENQKVVVQFYASWCGNCRLMNPKFKKLASENDEAAFIIIDAEKFPNARRLAEVDNLPTFVSYKNGMLVNKLHTSKFDELKALVDEVTEN